MIRLLNKIKLVDLAKIIGADLVAKSNNNDLENIEINTVASIEQAAKEDLTFLANSLYAKYLPATKAIAVILPNKYLSECRTNGLVTDNPRLALAKLLSLAVTPIEPKIHPSCSIGSNVYIGKNVNIEAGVIIGNNCVIGDNTIIKANVVLYENTIIGKNCIIHSNSVVGSDGFGYAQDHGNWVKIPHLGRVILEDRVEIGSNTSIDRGCIGDTIIKQGVIIDNLVQIAHNVTIGENTAIAGCVGIAGSTIIGKNCLIGGACNIGGHLFISDDVQITATSSISKSILKPGLYSSGFMVKENGLWKKNIARFNSLDHTIRSLTTRIKNLEKQLNIN